MAQRERPPTTHSSHVASEERTLTAQGMGNDWVNHYLNNVPFEHLYRVMLKHLAEQLRLILGQQNSRIMVSEMLKNLRGVINRGSLSEEEMHRRVNDGDISLLDDDNVDIDWQEIAVDLAHLFAFARYGEGPRHDPSESRDEIERLLAHFRELAASAAIAAAVGQDFEWITDTLAAAEARWAIDHGLPVTPDGLAALAGVKPKTIANLLAAREISADSEGKVDAAEALRYLERRKDFVRSRWREPPPPYQPVSILEPPELPEQVFVPVDSDGNPFRPSYARPGRDGVLRFAIGTKTDPEYVEDYWDALDRLSRMPTPRWRRPPPSGKGGWGLVSAQDGWRRFARQDLERMIEAQHAAKKA